MQKSPEYRWSDIKDEDERWSERRLQRLVLLAYQLDNDRYGYRVELEGSGTVLAMDHSPGWATLEMAQHWAEKKAKEVLYAELAMLGEESKLEAIRDWAESMDGHTDPKNLEDLWAILNGTAKES